MKTYLVSQDAGKIMTDWGTEKRFIVPKSDYFDQISRELVEDLQILFDFPSHNVVVRQVAFDFLRSGLLGLIESVGTCFVISLDKVYADGFYQLEINRTVCRNNGSWIDSGECHRPNRKTIKQQLDEICLSCQTMPIILVDDGLWTGSSILKIQRELEMRGKKLEEVLIGIHIDDGRTLPFKIRAVQAFSLNSIVDWICERDFLPGVPLGGRTVMDPGLTKGIQSKGAYYLFGFGDYRNWASLDVEEEKIRWFTQRRLNQMISLFSRIELLSNRSVCFGDLERIPYHLEYPSDKKIVEILKGLLSNL